MTHDAAFDAHTDFHRQMAESGLMLFPSTLDAEDLAALRSASEAAYAARRAVQVANGVAARMEGTAHHVLGGGDALDRFIDRLPLWREIGQHFGGKFILLNFGATLHPPGSSAYTLKPHRDVRAWTSDYPLSLNMLIMLDDFTGENGATLFLRGSHRVEQMPSDHYFERHAVQLEGKAGDILLFDSLVVHAAAPNRGGALRRALTLCFGRPFMKPQMDWPRFLAPGAESAMTAQGRQLLGYDAKVPASLDEYYQPADRWAFKADQK
jgi:hypothetical protein